MVLTFHSQGLISSSQVIRMIKYSATGSLPSAAWIIYAYLDGIVDLYIDLVDKIMMETQSLDELVLVLSGIKQNELFTRIGLAGRRVTNLHSGVFGKRVSLEVSDASNSVNRSMRKFTAISTIFIPMSLLTGVMGMNVRLPGMVDFDGGDTYYYFIGIMTIMI
eukprot:gene3585-4103_t